MTFTLYELALNPDIQERLRADIRDVLAQHDNKLTYEAMLDMKYLQMVIDGNYEIESLLAQLIT
jgi:cytochrome P450 family 6